eukprot:m.39363 g.39363  ORF g.39363 m.39363 type:complete len:59 (+) comp10299_c0_seq1:1035-1211(+)
MCHTCMETKGSGCYPKQLKPAHDHVDNEGNKRHQQHPINPIHWSSCVGCVSRSGQHSG